MVYSGHYMQYQLIAAMVGMVTTNQGNHGDHAMKMYLQDGRLVYGST